MAPAQVITLITDFGDAGGYAGIMKGVILSINPQCQIIDITHHISPQDREEAAFVLQSVHPFFPSNSVHLVVVDPGVGSTRNQIIVESAQNWFVGPDNGVFSFIYSKNQQKTVWKITNQEYFLSPVSATFHGRDIFAPIAAHLSLGVSPNVLGNELEHYVQLDGLEPEIGGDVLKARVICIDHFGNLISNISRQFFTRTVGAKPFRIRVGGQVINRVSNTYDDVEDRGVIALFGSSGQLEIAVRNGNCQKLLQVTKGSEVSVHVLP